MQDDAPPEHGSGHEAPPSTESAAESTAEEAAPSASQPTATALPATNDSSTSASASDDAHAAPAAQLSATTSETGQQTTTITGTAVAVATSGGNVAIATGSQSDDGDSQPAILGTGPAAASGSDDETSVVQEATAVLTGGATADITQVVLVFNIGAALANSGLNVIGGAAPMGRRSRPARPRRSATTPRRT